MKAKPVSVGGLAGLAVLCLGQLAAAAGLASSADFIVLAPDQAIADEVLQAATRYRRDYALRFAGGELLAGRGRTAISVRLSDREDHDLVWLIDAPGRKLHQVWIAAPRDRCAGASLAHAIGCAVLGTLNGPPAAGQGFAIIKGPERFSKGPDRFSKGPDRFNAGTSRRPAAPLLPQLPPVNPQLPSCPCQAKGCQ